jgi:hypothetical protein
MDISDGGPWGCTHIMMRGMNGETGEGTKVFHARFQGYEVSVSRNDFGKGYQALIGRKRRVVRCGW